MVYEKLLWRVTCPNRASSCILTGTTRRLILFRNQLLVLCSESERQKSFLRHLLSKVWIFLSGSASEERPCFTTIQEGGGDKRLV